MPIFQVIDSPTNDTLKQWVELKTPTGRAEQSLLLVEGPHPVREALAAGLNAVAFAFNTTTDEAANAQLAELPSSPTAPQFYRLSERAMKKVATTDTPPPILGIFQPKPHPTLEAALRETEPLRLLVLDGLQDPGNMGTLLRTAVAFGITGIIVVTPAVDPMSPKVIRASAGLLFRLPVWRWEAGLTELIDTLLSAGVDVHLTAVGSNANSQAASQVEWKPRQALVLGSEGSGIRMTPLEYPALPRLKIPMAPAAESLNVAMSGAILLSHWYEASCRTV